MARLKGYLNMIKRFGIYFLPALYLLAAGSVALAYPSLLTQILSVSVIVLGIALSLVTYRLLVLLQFAKDILRKVEAQVLISPKVATEVAHAAQEELERILSEDFEEALVDIKKEVIH